MLPDIDVYFHGMPAAAADAAMPARAILPLRDISLPDGLPSLSFFAEFRHAAFFRCRRFTLLPRLLASSASLLSRFLSPLCRLRYAATVCHEYRFATFDAAARYDVFAIIFTHQYHINIST